MCEGYQSGITFSNCVSRLLFFFLFSPFFDSFSRSFRRNQLLYRACKYTPDRAEWLFGFHRLISFERSGRVARNFYFVRYARTVERRRYANLEQRFSTLFFFRSVFSRYSRNQLNPFEMIARIRTKVSRSKIRLRISIFLNGIVHFFFWNSCNFG